MPKGIAASPGIAMGKAYILEKEEYCILEYKIKKEEVEQELKRFETAVENSKKDLGKIKKRVEEEMGEKEAYIFQAHLYILEDPLFIQDITRRIKRQRLNAETAVKRTLEVFEAKFASARAEFVRRRFGDVEDVGGHILRNLLKRPTRTLSRLEEDIIVVTNDLAPSDTASMQKGRILGFATNVGGRTSHSAIMARSMEIPAVVGLRDITKKVEPGSVVILDGNRGRVIINPSFQQLENYRKKKERFISHKKDLEILRSLPAQTPDGREVSLAANIAVPEEVELAAREGAEGVGLYRTEYLYMNRSSLPSEDEQVEAYKKVLEKAAPNSVIIRTLDLGGDKFLSHFPMPAEINPFMGWRAIRLCLERVDIFETQLRAILRASRFGNGKIMYPMISGVEEIRKVNQILAGIKEKLRREGTPFAENVEAGIMIEIPSAAIIADLLAKEVDFFSLGTNDLIQYSLAVDRVNEKVAYLYQPLHPTILRLIDNVIKCAHREGIWVGVCGEMASDPLFVLILLGLGVDEFSVAPTNLLEIKKIIRSIEWEETQEIAVKILKSKTSYEAKRFAERRLSRRIKRIVRGNNNAG